MRVNRTFIFIGTVAIFSVGLAPSYVTIEMSNTLKVALVVAAIVLFICVEYIKGRYLNTKTKLKICRMILEKCQMLRYIDPSQRLRANIFKIDTKASNGYSIICHCNMDEHQDKDLFIEQNMGVTGETFRSKKQTFATQKQFFAEHRLPEETIKKVPPDLEWICSTPILINKKKNFKYTVSVDGNVSCEDKQDEIKEFCTRLADELAEILRL